MSNEGHLIQPTRSGIRIDWTVPVWGVVGLLAQAAALLIWGASLSEKVDTHTRDIADLKNTSEAVVRLDERTQAIYDSLQRLERASERASRQGVAQ